MILKNKKLYNWLLEFSIFSLLLLSSLIKILPVTTVTTGRVIVMVLLFSYTFLKFIFVGTDKRILFGISLELILIGICFFSKLNILMFFIFVNYCLWMDGIKILQNYRNAMLCAVVVVVVLSFFGVLPIKLNGLWVFGFNNPNILGLLLTQICLLNFVFYSKRYYFNYFCIILLFLFDIYYLDDGTSKLCLIIFILLYSLYKLKYVRLLIIRFTLFLPTLLAAFTVFLTINFGKFQWTEELSEWLTNRPKIWNIYFNNYGINMWPQSVIQFSANDFTRRFFGNNLPIFYRGFDGSYIYNFITLGFFIGILLIIATTFFIYKIKKDRALSCTICSLLFYSFTESAILAPFGYYESFLLVISIVVIIRGYFYKNSVEN